MRTIPRSRHCGHNEEYMTEMSRIHRMEGRECVLKKIMNGRPYGTHQIGKPKLRWRDQAQ
jgi:hypothetical protein